MSESSIHQGRIHHEGVYHGDYYGTVRVARRESCLHQEVPAPQKVGATVSQRRRRRSRVTRPSDVTTDKERRRIVETGLSLLGSSAVYSGLSFAEEGFSGVNDSRLANYQPFANDDRWVGWTLSDGRTLLSCPLVLRRLRCSEPLQLEKHRFADTVNFRVVRTSRAHRLT